MRVGLGRVDLEDAEAELRDAGPVVEFECRDICSCNHSSTVIGGGPRFQLRAAMDSSTGAINGVPDARARHPVTSSTSATTRERPEERRPWHREMRSKSCARRILAEHGDRFDALRDHMLRLIDATTADEHPQTTEPVAVLSPVRDGVLCVFSCVCVAATDGQPITVIATRLSAVDREEAEVAPTDVEALAFSRALLGRHHGSSSRSASSEMTDPVPRIARCAPVPVRGLPARSACGARRQPHPDGRDPGLTCTPARRLPDPACVTRGSPWLRSVTRTVACCPAQA